ncbi:MAG: BTAD domain-containing putative transcriptional regulator [Sneathiella sp.]
MSEVRLFLFGHFRWQFAGGQLAPPMRDKAQALLAFLALSPTGIVKRSQAAELLWGRGKDPRASLRQAVREIKITESRFGTQFFSSDKKFLKLDLAGLWIDARIASACASSFDVDQATSLVLEASGRLLEDCIIEEDAFDDWQVTECSRRDADFGIASDRLLDFMLQNRASGPTLKEIALKIIALNGSHEEAHRVIMQLYHDQGDSAAALKQFDICTRCLQEELGIEPSEETLALAEQIRQATKRRIPAEVGSALIAPAAQLNEVLMRPVIQVQPFQVSGSDSVLDFFTQIFRTDLCEQLCRNRRFSIRDSSLPHVQNALIGGGQEGRAIFSHYAIRGHVVSRHAQVGLLIQLLEGRSGDILWTKRLNYHMRDLPEAGERSAVQAAIELIRFVELQEMEKATNTPDPQLNARQCVTRAKSIMFKFSKEAVTLADGYLDQALLMYPQYGEAVAWKAFLKSIEIGQGYAADQQATRDEIRDLAHRAIELCPHDDIVLAILGHLEAFIHHDFGGALELFDRSLLANPNCAYTWGFSAITHCYIGKAEEALSMLTRCRTIMPFDPHPYYFDTARCIASMLTGQYEDAVRIGKQVLRNNPNFHASYRPLLSSLGHLERQEEAEPVLQEFAKCQPDFSVSWHLANYPPLGEEKTEQYVTGLRKAGVGE